MSFCPPPSYLLLPSYDSTSIYWRLRPGSRWPHLKCNVGLDEGEYQQNCLCAPTPNHAIIFPPFAQLHWLPVNQCITYKLCLLMHLVYVKHCPDYLNNLVHLTADSATRSGLHSATRLSYRKPALASKFSKRAFSYAGPAAWNSLPDHIQSITNTASFKRQLKTFLFSACSYYWTGWCLPDYCVGRH